MQEPFIKCIKRQLQINKGASRKMVNAHIKGAIGILYIEEIKQYLYNSVITLYLYIFKSII